MPPKKVRLSLVDLDTGEIQDGIPVLPGRKSALSAMYGKGEFLIMANEGLKKLREDEELLKKEPMKVLLYLLETLDYENYIRVAQKDICEALGMRKPNVSKAIKLLEQKGVILRGDRSLDRSFTYRLNSSYAYKGDARKVIQGNFGAPRRFEVIEGGKSEGAMPDPVAIEMQRLEQAGQQRLFE